MVTDSTEGTDSKGPGRGGRAVQASDTLASQGQPDIAIIGGGIVGICTALSLQAAGLNVVIVERDEPGQSTSYGNAGVISPWSNVPQSVPGLWKKIPYWLLHANGPISIKPSYALRFLPWAVRFMRRGNETHVLQASKTMEYLNRHNVDLYRQHLAGTGQEHLIRGSYYVHAFRDAAQANIADRGYKIRAEAGAQVEQISAQELRELEPALSAEYNAAILIKGQGRATSPGKIGQVLCAKFSGNGGTVLKRTVSSLQQRDDSFWVIKTDAEPVVAKHVVVAAGAWSAKLLAPLGIQIPLEAERGYHVEFTEPGISLTNSVMDMDYMFVASSMEYGLRVAGTAEFAGLDAPMNQKRVDSLLKNAKRMFPDLQSDTHTSWMGTRPSLPDSVPALGEFKDHKGLFAAFGHCHYGLMMAPRTGQVITSMVTGVPINEDISGVSPDRF